MTEFADQLASSNPTPGGGAAAARTGRFAVSLVRMVLSITREKCDDAEVGDRLDDLKQRAEKLSSKFYELELADMEAFEGYMASFRLPRSTDEEKAARRQARLKAAERATVVPLETLQAATEVLDLVSAVLELQSRVKIRAEADLGGAVELANGAFNGAAWNVRVNLPELKDSVHLDNYRERWVGLSNRIQQEAAALRERVGRLLPAQG